MILNNFKKIKISKKIMFLCIASGCFIASIISISSFKVASIKDGKKEIMSITNYLCSPSEILKQAKIDTNDGDNISVEEKTDNNIKILIKRSIPIKVKTDDEEIEYFAHSGEQVLSFLENNSICLGENDKISIPLEEEIYDEIEIKITRQFKIKVIADSNMQEFLVPSVAIEDALRYCGINLGEFDQCSPNKNFIILNDATITVDRINFSEICKNEEIPFKTETLYDLNSQEGSVEVKKEGEAGEYKIILKRKFINGIPEEDNDEEISREIIKEPIKKIIKIGAKKIAKVNSLTFPYEKILTGVVTAYSKNAGTTTSLGKRVRHGIVAVDPRIIPYGTPLYIEGYGYAVAGDTGGAMRNGSVLVDVFFDSETQCRAWGRQVKKVYVLKRE